MPIEFSLVKEQVKFLLKTFNLVSDKPNIGIESLNNGEENPLFM